MRVAASPGVRLRKILAVSSLSLGFAVAGSAAAAPSLTASNSLDAASAASGPTTVEQSAPSAIPTHIETWAYDEGCSSGSTCQGGSAPASLVNQWVTYAESGGGSKALTDCHSSTNGCKALMYLDPNRIYSVAGASVPIASRSSEDWWLHAPGYSDSNHRLSATYNGASFANLLNDAAGGVASWFQGYVQANYDGWDGLMVDDVAPGVSLQVYGSGYSSSQELASDAQVISMHRHLASALTHRDGVPFLQVDNSASVNPWLPLAGTFQLLGGPVVGLIAEGAPVQGGAMTNYYATLLDVMAKVDATPDAFLVLMSYDPSGTLQWRRVQAATVLLGYSPHHTVSWSNLEYSTTHLAIWPEEGIYPTQPVQSMTSPLGPGCFAGTGAACPAGGHNDLEVAPGIYRREFGRCYDRGVAFGRCAVIVNTTSSPVATNASWFEGAYGHEITMNGGTVETGGTVNLAGAVYAPGAAVPAKDALLLAP